MARAQQIATTAWNQAAGNSLGCAQPTEREAIWQAYSQGRFSVATGPRSWQNPRSKASESVIDMDPKYGQSWVHRAGSGRASNSVGERFHGEKARNEISSRLTWTALDVGGPCVEAFRRIHVMAHLPWLQGRELQEAASGAKSNRWHSPCCWLPFLISWFVVMRRHIHSSRLRRSKSRGRPRNSRSNDFGSGISGSRLKDCRPISGFGSPGRMGQAFPPCA